MAAQGLTGLTSSYRRLSSCFFALSVIVTLWGALWALIAWDYRTEIRAGFVQTDALSRALAEHTERILWEADQLARNVSLAVLERGIDIPLHHYFELGLAQSDVFLQIALVDRDGTLRASTEAEFEPINLADRTHILAHIEGVYDGLYIGKPVIGRASGKPSIQLSRAVRDAQDQLVGIVVISVDPRYLANFYRDVGAAANISTLIIGTQDFVVRAQQHADDTLRPVMLPSNSTLRHALRQSSAGSFMKPGEGSQPDRLVSYRELATYPVAVAVSASRDDVLAPFRVRRNLLLTAGLLLTVFILYIERKRWLLMEQLAESARQLDAALKSIAVKAGNTETLFAAAPDPLAHIAADGRVAAMNPGMRALLGLKPDDPLPADIGDLVTRLYARNAGSTSSATPAELCSHLMTALRREPRKTMRRILQFNDRTPRCYEVRSTSLPPPGAGLMLVVRDVTSFYGEEAPDPDSPLTPSS